MLTYFPLNLTGMRNKKNGCHISETFKLPTRIFWMHIFRRIQAAILRWKETCLMREGECTPSGVRAFACTSLTSLGSLTRASVTGRLSHNTPCHHNAYFETQILRKVYINVMTGYIFHRRHEMYLKFFFMINGNIFWSILRLLMN